MTASTIINHLNYLHKILQAGETGYSVAAVNMKNPAMRVMFKSYAHQRATFKAEIENEINRLGGTISTRTSLRGVIHRGRMNILSSLIVETDGREKMILKEILLGEAAALDAYKKASSPQLDATTAEIVEKQHEEVKATVEQIHMLLGKNGRKQLIYLFHSEDEVERCVRSLAEAGLSAEPVEKIAIGEITNIYRAKNSTISDAFFAGAVGGALWGSVIGAVAGLGATSPDVLDPSLLLSPQLVWAMIAIAGIAGGTFVGGILGFFVGIGSAEEDAYQYSHSMTHGHTLVKITVEKGHEKVTGQILANAHLGTEMA